MLTARLRARILAATRKPPKDGSTHWSCRKLAAELGVSKDAVHRVWQEAGLEPIKAYSANAKPIQWKYSDPTRRIRSNELSATGH